MGGGTIGGGNYGQKNTTGRGANLQAVQSRTHSYNLNTLGGP